MPKYFLPKTKTASQKPLRLGKSERAKRLRKRLGKRLVLSEPIDGARSTVRSRGLGFHLKLFDLSKEELKGKRVLFIGSGKGIAVKEARREGINAFGLEPYLFPRTFKKFTYKKTIQKFIVRKPFDFVIAVWSVPVYLKKAYDLRLSFFRMLSTLKVGGELFVYPIQYKVALIFPQSIERKIKKAGFEITLIPGEEIGKRLNWDSLYKGCTPSNALVIKRASQSNLRKLQELFSL